MVRKIYKDPEESWEESFQIQPSLKKNELLLDLTLMESFKNASLLRFFSKRKNSQSKMNCTRNKAKKKITKTKIYRIPLRRLSKIQEKRQITQKGENPRSWSSSSRYLYHQLLKMKRKKNFRKILPNGKTSKRSEK